MDQSTTILRTAAIFAAGGGLVHAAAIGVHSESTLLVWSFTATAVAQVVWAASVAWRASGRVVVAGVLLNGAVAAAWLLTRVVTIPGLEEFGGPVDRMGVAAAALAAAAAGTAGWSWREPTGFHVDLRAIVGVTVVVVALGATAGHGHGGGTEGIPIEDAGAISDRMPYIEARALLALSARAPLGSDHAGHDHGGHHHGDHDHGDPFAGPADGVRLSPAEAGERERQLAVAAQAAARFPTIESAIEAGYVQSSTDGPGVGQHWVKWTLVDRPFDAALPSMLLFSEVTRGREPELVGLSYFVASDGPPEGFAGPEDEWHSHRGMCFVNGWLLDENVEERADCRDVWIDGIDLWMLHAWVVDGHENPWGLFAAVNPQLCLDRPQMPDAISCDPAGR